MGANVSVQFLDENQKLINAFSLGHAESMEFNTIQKKGVGIVPSNAKYMKITTKKSEINTIGVLGITNKKTTFGEATITINKHNSNSIREDIISNGGELLISLENDNNYTIISKEKTVENFIDSNDINYLNLLLAIITLWLIYTYIKNRNQTSQ